MFLLESLVRNGSVSINSLPSRRRVTKADFPGTFMKWSTILTPIPCAMLFCLANACKPAVIDDLPYLWYARQIAQTPTQPFGPPPDGFPLIWYQHGQPAFTLLMPMVLPYWLALGLTLVGENLFLLKLWLFPFCLLLAASLYSLGKRFAPGMEKLLMVLTVFSPAFLPSLNVMIDVPAIALGLTAIAKFCRSLDGPRPRWQLVVCAGIIAGLAAQTKYTGMTAVAVLLLYGVARRQRLAGITAVAIAVGVFAGWEAYLTHVYGRSHFLSQLELRRTKTPMNESAGPIERWGSELSATLEKKAGMTAPLFGYLGGLGLPLLPLFLLALRLPVRFVHYFSAVAMAGFLTMTLLPERWAVFYRDPEIQRNVVSVSTIFMGAMGVSFVLLLGAGCAVLGFRRTLRLRRSGTCWFLIGWLVIEVLAYFALTPFAAARRVMGILVVAAIIIGRILSARRDSLRAKWIARHATLGVAIGVLYASTDYRDALAERAALFESVRLVHEQAGAKPRIWFTGHWGFQYYGEQQGLHAINPGESLLEAGDWIIVPDQSARPYAQTIRLEAPYVEKRGVVEIHEVWPLSTNSIYYDGYMPIRRHDGPRLRIAVYRVSQRFRAWTD
jgi:hypothetical protein